MIIVISLDGVCHEDLNLNRLPNLKLLAEQGVYTKRLRVAFPSTTWINHTSAITGKTADEHGVLGGFAYSRSRNLELGYFEPHLFDINDVPVPTIFEKATGKGKTTAAVCWPLTQGSSDIHYNIPECYSQEQYNDYSTPEFVRELVENGFEFYSYADWSIDFRLCPMQDDLTCRITEYLIEQKQVDLLFTHFLVHDSFQHIYGIHTPESEWSLRYLDGLAGRIIDSLRLAGKFDESHIIVMSDHGHEAINKFFDLQSFLKTQEIPDEAFHCVNNGGAALLYSKQDGITKKDIAGLYAALKKHEAVEIVCSKEDDDILNMLGLSPLPNPDTFPDIVIALNHGWYLDQQQIVKGNDDWLTAHTRTQKGSHGHWPETHPRMDSFMIKAGEKFPKGVVEDSGHICDLYSIVAKLLDA